jgi:hypothetical protein
LNISWKWQVGKNIGDFLIKRKNFPLYKGAIVFVRAIVFKTFSIAENALSEKYKWQFSHMAIW